MRWLCNVGKMKVRVLWLLVNCVKECFVGCKKPFSF